MREDGAQGAVSGDNIQNQSAPSRENCDSVPQVPAISSVQYSKHSERIVFLAKSSPVALEITSQDISTSMSSCRLLQVAMSSC